ncbi:LysR family transcriptional regulator, partial [Rhodoplanes elegans]
MSMMAVMGGSWERQFSIFRPFGRHSNAAARHEFMLSRIVQVDPPAGPVGRRERMLRVDGTRLGRLRAFDQVATAGGMTAAAAALRLTQPAVSRAVGALEAELGVTLV